MTDDEKADFDRRTAAAMTPEAAEHRRRLNERAMSNTRIDGWGAGVVTHLTCPFCGAADWLAFPVTAGLNDYADVKGRHACKECGRTGEIKIVRDGGAVVMSLVQVAGGPLPDWFWPPIPFQRATAVAALASAEETAVESRPKEGGS